MLFAILFIFISLGSLRIFLLCGNDDQIPVPNNSVFLPICVATDYVSKSDRCYLLTFNIKRWRYRMCVRSSLAPFLRPIVSRNNFVFVNFSSGQF